MDHSVEVAARLADFPECDVCQGLGRVWDMDPEHEKCCGRGIWVDCPECNGVGYKTPPEAMQVDSEVCCGRANGG